MLSITVLAAGVVGTALGFVVGEFRARVARTEAAAARGHAAYERQRREIAHEGLREARAGVMLLGLENSRLQDDVRDLWAEHDALRAALADVRRELEAEQEAHHEQRERAEQAERLPSWMRAAVVPFEGTPTFDGVVVPGPGYPQ